MKLPYAEPEPAGSERARIARKCRTLAMETARLRPQATTNANGEEQDHGAANQPSYPANFTKGLSHDKNGLLTNPTDYRDFVEAINSPEHTLFERQVRGHGDYDPVAFSCEILPKGKEGESSKPEWRGWESPRAGHVYDLEGPDAGAVGMAPAPRVGSSEMALEMAEVYALALLRDVPFSSICANETKKLCEKESEALLAPAEIAQIMNEMPFFSEPVSSTPHQVNETGLNCFEKNRRDARLIASKELTPESLFRGSTKGAMIGPYISQFMLIGSNSRNCETGITGQSNFPGTGSAFDFRDGFINFGTLPIDQRTLTAKSCLDYMTDWPSWLDVQNGADFRNADVYEDERRFITTPRDLATYVHFDALYQAYLNAALILDSFKVPASKGFPETSPSARRTGFATFGGPHVLSLVTEVATRCLKAVRRQKFNYHRRARPEALGGRLAMLCHKGEEQLGCAGAAFTELLKGVPEPILAAIAKHNEEQSAEEINQHRRIKCEPDDHVPPGDCNYLLPMAFPEGSPMHPAYGAGHATVAGGCVTMLKAFFEMYEDCNSGKERELCTEDGMPVVYEADPADGKKLRKAKKFEGALTIQGELDKLAANISIGRNMAGVHYYSDYFDSLRLGERVAVGILMEQAPTYNEAMEVTFKSFDGDLITIKGEGGQCASLTVLGFDGSRVPSTDWWLRHVPGEEIIEDF